MSSSPSSPRSSPSADHSIVKAVMGTAVGTLVVAAIFFWVFWKLVAGRVKRSRTDRSFRREDVTDKMFGKLGKNVKGLIVDEGGVDVLYLRKLEEGQHRSYFSKAFDNPSYEDHEEEKRVCCLTESSGQSASKRKNVHPIYEDYESLYESTSEQPGKLTLKDPASKLHALPPQPAIPTAGPSPASVPYTSIQQMTASPPPPPPPPPPPTLLPRPSPPPSPPLPAPPPPPTSRPLRPLIPPKRKGPAMPTPPPPPPKAGAGVMFSSTKPPPAPRGKATDESRTCNPREESSGGADHGPTKLKPLHWDKVISNVDHSVVWDQINDGSLR